MNGRRSCPRMRGSISMSAPIARRFLSRGRAIAACFVPTDRHLVRPFKSSVTAVTSATTVLFAEYFAKHQESQSHRWIPLHSFRSFGSVRLRLPKVGSILGRAGRWLCFKMSAVLQYCGPIAGIVYKELVSSAD
jgi:hypothetical protein